MTKRDVVLTVSQALAVCGIVLFVPMSERILEKPYQWGYWDIHQGPYVVSEPEPDNRYVIYGESLKWGNQELPPAYDSLVVYKRPEDWFGYWTDSTERIVGNPYYRQGW